MKWNVSVLRRSGECERTEVADFELSEFFNRIASVEGKVWACVLNHSPLPLMNDSFRRTISIENVAPDSVLYAFQ